jgi:hypothetical protein
VHSRDILPKAKMDHLDRIHSDQMALKTITWGRLVLFIGGQEFQSSLKEEWLAHVHSDQMVFMTVRQEAGPCELRLTQGLHSLRTLK